VLGAVGLRLLPGDRILAGSLTHVEAGPGDRVVAEIDSLGRVEVALGA
jgi:2-keto-4-pentenoate hydratase